jgi:hypothetical protein
MAIGVIIITALFAFEVFNYSTTDFALTDLLGNLRFAGLRWATILAIAFCGIDFAGIARLFTPEGTHKTDNETWYLFGAWLLAATMNAMLTWWGVSLAILNHDTLGNAVIGREVLLRAVPIFVALMVWLIRVLIIGTFSVAGDRLFSIGDEQRPRQIARPANRNFSRPGNSALVSAHSLSQRPVTLRATSPRSSTPTASNQRSPATSRPVNSSPVRNMRPAPPPPEPPEKSYIPQEPTYQPLFGSIGNADVEVGDPHPVQSRSTQRHF